MPQEKKFIKTTDKETADKLMSAGFALVSHNSSVYTFLNLPPQNFSFAEVDKKKMAYTNILNI